MNAAVIYVQNSTSPQTFTNIELHRLVWSLKYWARYQFNRSPWVEHGIPGVYSAQDLKQLDPGLGLPVLGWMLEILDNSDQPGALGYHEDQSRISKAGDSGIHSIRGAHLHLATGKEVPLMKVFAKTCKEDGVFVSEVCSHEIAEALVDPWVMDEANIRKYLDKDTKQWWIGEVGDPVQNRAYDLGDPEGRPCGVPESMMADIAYPMLFGQEQRRNACSFTEDAESWLDGKTPNTGLKPFTIASGGYMSVAPEDEPTNWSPVYGEEAPHIPNPE